MCAHRSADKRQRLVSRAGKREIERFVRGNKNLECARGGKMPLVRAGHTQCLLDFTQH